MMEDETTRLTGLQELGENLEHTLHAKRSALEILTNLCCGLDANLDEWEDINDSDQVNIKFKLAFLHLLCIWL